jgi:hypothetical protein
VIDDCATDQLARQRDTLAPAAAWLTPERAQRPAEPETLDWIELVGSSHPDHRHAVTSIGQAHDGSLQQGFETIGDDEDPQSAPTGHRHSRRRPAARSAAAQVVSTDDAHADDATDSVCDVE